MLHAFTGDIPGDGGVVRLPGDLVDLVDEDNAALGLRLVEIGLLQEPGKQAFHVLAHITGFRQHGRIDNRERDIQQAGDGLREQRLARTGGTDQQDVGLFQFHAVVGLGDQVVADALVMIVHGHGKDGLGPVLADDILVQEVLDLLGFRGFVHRPYLRTPLGRGVFQLGHVLGGHLRAVGANVTVDPLQHEGDLGIRPAAQDAPVPGGVGRLPGHQRDFLVRISSTMP